MIDGMGRTPPPQAAVIRTPPQAAVIRKPPQAAVIRTPPQAAGTSGNMPVKVTEGEGVTRVGGAAPVAGQGAAASNLGRIAKDLAASPPVDAGKVATLKAAIASGNYRPDPAKIAERMVALETLPPKG
nr:flagellar biosynthesis anti-sigma factor FlgM [Polymorphobacter sp.]